MPMINIEDAYILDETGAQVDQVTGLYFKNENASDTEKAQARANIGAGGTNPNLLDNAYFAGGGSQLGDGVFPINQRGQTQYTGDAQTHLDRWWQQYNTDISLTSAGLRITGYWDVDQRFAQPLPSDTYTLSVDVASLNSTGAVLWFLNASYQQLGSVTITGTGVTTLTMTSDQISGVGVSLASPSGNGDITIRAMKLEKGTVSTLANDGPPDFWAELEKCMRRFRRIKAEASYYIFATVLAEAATYTVGMIDLPVPMASKPTISTNGSFRLWTGAGENPVTVSSIGIFDAICPLTNCSRIGIIAYPSANLTADARYDLQANNDTNAYIDLSCEI